MLAMLFGCGLRRSELADLELEDIQTRQGHWAIVHLIGKGGHVRTVPIPQWAKQALDEWDLSLQNRQRKRVRTMSSCLRCGARQILCLSTQSPERGGACSEKILIIVVPLAWYSGSAGIKRPATRLF
jgi:site-specific recombinase XerC